MSDLLRDFCARLQTESLQGILTQKAPLKRNVHLLQNEREKGRES